MTRSARCLLCASPLLLYLGSCAAPSPYRGEPAPVIDRSSVLNQPRPGLPRPSPVEVIPLERPLPIAPQGPLLGEAGEASTAPITRPKPKPAPVAETGQGSQAVAALLDSAANHVSGGDLDKAAADLERALRIEPKNAAIWHDLGQIRLHQRQYDQAEAMASKSNALAGGNPSLQARNWRLIAIARRSLGNAAGADAAEAQAVQLEN